MTTLSLRQAKPSQLADLLRIPGESDRDWMPDELAAIYRHQLSASIENDLAELAPELGRRFRIMAASDTDRPETFGQLFERPAPPDWLLELTKHYAKAHRNAARSPLPQEVATVLYFMSVAAAMVRCSRRISNLDNEALREGFAWCHSQSWVDQASRELMGQALGLLNR